MNENIPICRVNPDTADSVCLDLPGTGDDHHACVDLAPGRVDSSVVVQRVNTAIQWAYELGQADRYGTTEQAEANESLQGELNQRVEQVENLNVQINRLTDERDRAQAEAQMWQRDCEFLGDGIHEEAIRREWCSEYDSWRDRMEGGLRRYTMPTRSESLMSQVILDIGFDRSHDDPDASEIMGNICRSIYAYIGNNLPGDYSYSITDYNVGEIENADG